METQTSYVAQTLQEGIKLFDPKKTLEGEDLKKYYIQRGSTATKEIKIYLLGAEDSKILFSGHRGSGKSTELNRLSSEIEAEYKDLILVKYSIESVLDTYDLEISDILFTMVSQVYKKIQEKSIPVDKVVLEELENYVKEVTKEVEEIDDTGLDLYAKLKLLFFGASAKYKTEVITRKKIREQLKPRIGKLIEILNLMVMQAKLNKKKVLIVIDGLDHPSTEVARKIFDDYGFILAQPKCSIIYTIPISLVYTSTFQNILQIFDYKVILPNVNVTSENGFKILKEVIAKRLNTNLLTEEALEEVIKKSGGVMRELIGMVRTACVEAIVNDQDIITLDTIKKVVNERKNDFKRILIREQQYTALKLVHEKKDLDIRADEEIVNQIPDLLYNLSILEYNDSVWWDVHPVVLDLLEK